MDKNTKTMRKNDTISQFVFFKTLLLFSVPQFVSQGIHLTHLNYEERKQFNLSTVVKVIYSTERCRY